jgi:hypothetical protein
MRDPPAVPSGVAGRSCPPPGPYAILTLIHPFRMPSPYLAEKQANKNLDSIADCDNNIAICNMKWGGGLMSIAVTFHEEQKGPRWIWLLLIPHTILTALLVYGVVQQVGFGRPFGDRPLSDAGLIFVTLTVVGLMSFALWMALRLRLIVRVGEGQVDLRFLPLWTRRLPLQEIESVSVRTYRPILEYGGWGLRLGWKGWAYNLSGNQGVQLYLRHGWPVLIGTPQPHVLAAAILQAKAGEGSRA